MLALGLATGATVACDPHGQAADTGDATGASDDPAEDTEGGACEAPADTGGAEGEACAFVPEEGPALLDFGQCELMGSGGVIGACGNTGIHRRCDAAFLAWCNEQGGDVSACDEDDTFDAVPFVPCGTGPNAIACDIPFRDNCDSLDGSFVCFDHDCTLGACIPVLPACQATAPCGGGEIGCASEKDAVQSSCTNGTNSAGQNFVHCVWIEADTGKTQESGAVCGQGPGDGDSDGG